jgi:hypothetical protein
MASWDNSAEQRPHVTGKRDGVVSRTQHSTVLACPPRINRNHSRHILRAAILSTTSGAACHEE